MPLIQKLGRGTQLAKLDLKMPIAWCQCTQVTTICWAYIGAGTFILTEHSLSACALHPKYSWQLQMHWPGSCTAGVSPTSYITWMTSCCWGHQRLQSVHRHCTSPFASVMMPVKTECTNIVRNLHQHTQHGAHAASSLKS